MKCVTVEALAEMDEFVNDDVLDAALRHTSKGEVEPDSCGVLVAGSHLVIRFGIKDRSWRRYQASSARCVSGSDAISVSLYILSRLLGFAAIINSMTRSLSMIVMTFTNWLEMAIWPS